MSRLLPTLESTLATEPEVLFYLCKDGRLISDDLRYGTPDRALAEVERRNEIEPGHTYIRVPSRVTACEGCEDPAGIYYDTGTNHLVKFTWVVCPSHEYSGHYSAEY
ncbi:hypothetical protein ACF05W_03200 [Streptomyces lydicus]|uniref:hypothetical protein n=1 Tax=Streptomyces lydicus TaxID=47763 RepID=UPI0036FE6F98